MARPKKDIIDGKTTCSKCGKLKPVSDFCKDKRKKSGLRSHCKSCANEYYKKYCTENKEKVSFWSNQYAKRCKQTARGLKQKCVNYKGGKCSICGYFRCIAALDFHHVNPNEKEISNLSHSKNWNKIKKELDKCICICSNCHREIHYYSKKGT